MWGWGFFSNFATLVAKLPLRGQGVGYSEQLARGNCCPTQTPLFGQGMGLHLHLPPHPPTHPPTQSSELCTPRTMPEPSFHCLLLTPWHSLVVHPVSTNTCRQRQDAGVPAADDCAADARERELGGPAWPAAPVYALPLPSKTTCTRTPPKKKHAGSGKTLAFLLPMIALLARAREQGGSAWPSAPKALLLSPTHELAAQTARVLKVLLPGSGLKCCLLSKKSAGGCWGAQLSAMSTGFLLAG
jgi:hypothetical protein